MMTLLFKTAQKDYISQAIGLIIQHSSTSSWLEGSPWQSQIGSRFLAEALFPVFNRDNFPQISTLYAKNPDNQYEPLPIHTFLKIYISSVRYCVDPINYVITQEILEKRILKACKHIDRLTVGAYFPSIQERYDIRINTTALPEATQYFFKLLGHK